MIISVEDAKAILSNSGSELSDDEIRLLVEQLEMLVNCTYNQLLEEAKSNEK